MQEITGILKTLRREDGKTFAYKEMPSLLPPVLLFLIGTPILSFLFLPLGLVPMWIGYKWFKARSEVRSTLEKIPNAIKL